MQGVWQINFYIFSPKVIFSVIKRECSSVGGCGFDKARRMAQLDLTGCHSHHPSGGSSQGQLRLDLAASRGAKETVHFSQVDLGLASYTPHRELPTVCDQNPGVQGGAAHALLTN